MNKQENTKLVKLNINTFFERILSGSFAGAFSRTLTAPLELAKIQQQNKHIPLSSISGVWREEGIRGLFKGNGLNCARIAPQLAINYTVYETIQDYWKKYNQSRNRDDQNISVMNTTQHLFSGAISGAVSISAIYPMETIRTRLSLQSSSTKGTGLLYTGVFDAFRKIPMRQLYGGLGTSIVGFAPFNGILFASKNFYHSTLDHFLFQQKQRMDLYPYYSFTYQTNGEILANIFNTVYENKDSILSLVSGGLSGMTAITITYPTDLIRRRLQTQTFANTPKYNGAVDCVRKIIRNEGVAGLYSGIRPSYQKLLLSMSIQFWCIDQVMSVLNNRKN